MSRPISVIISLSIFLLCSSIYLKPQPVQATRPIKWIKANIPNTSSNVIRISRSNPNIVYLPGVVGDRSYIFKSTDYGHNFTAGFSVLYSTDINSIAVSYTNPDKLWLGIWGGGIYYSINGGGSWSRPTAYPYWLRTLEVDPTNDSVVYAGTGSTNNDGGIYKSVTGGVSWYQLVNPQTDSHNSMSIAIDKTNSSKIFADADPNIYSSIDGGSSWTQLSLGYIGQDTITIDNSLSNTIYAVHYGKVYKSINNGVDWTEKNNGLRTQLVHKIIQDSDGTLYLTKRGNPGGIWRSTDRAESWEDITDPSWTNSGSSGIDVKNGHMIVTLEQGGVYYADVGTPPVPTDPNPVVFIPGFLGSWSYKGIVENQPTTYADWKLTPVFTDDYYQPLLATLKNAGLTENNNLFTFAYDWRQPVAENAAILNTFLTNEVLPKNPGKKTNIAAHSMGGLVVRYCFEKISGCADKIEKIITGGTPHLGALQAYPLWEAGQYQETNPILKVLETIALRAQAPYYLTNKDIIQNKITSVRDILPIFNYIKGKPYSSLSSIAKNPALEFLKNPTSKFTNSLLTFSGNSLTTNSEFSVSPPSNLEKALGLWPDGKIISTANSSGDGTVLLTSASLTPAANKSYALEHKDYFRTTGPLNDLFTNFNLSGPPVTSANSTSSFLAFLVHSPVTIQIFDTNNQLLGPENKFAFLKNPSAGTYRVHVLSDATGGPFTLEAYLTNSQDPVTVKSYRNVINPQSGQDYFFSYDGSPASHFVLSEADHLPCITSSLALVSDPSIHAITDNINLQTNNQLDNVYLFLTTALAGKSNPADRQKILQANECLLSWIDLKKNYPNPSAAQVKQLTSQVNSLISTNSNRSGLTPTQAANILLAKDHLDKSQTYTNSKKPFLALLTTKAAAILAAN